MDASTARLANQDSPAPLAVQDQRDILALSVSPDIPADMEILAHQVNLAPLVRLVPSDLLACLERRDATRNTLLADKDLADPEDHRDQKDHKETRDWTHPQARLDPLARPEALANPVDRDRRDPLEKRAETDALDRMQSTARARSDLRAALVLVARVAVPAALAATAKRRKKKKM